MTMRMTMTVLNDHRFTDTSTWLCDTCGQDAFHRDHDRGCPKRRAQVTRLLWVILLAAVVGVAIGVLSVLPGVD